MGRDRFFYLKKIQNHLRQILVLTLCFQVSLPLGVVLRPSASVAIAGPEDELREVLAGLDTTDATQPPPRVDPSHLSGQRLKITLSDGTVEFDGSLDELDLSRPSIAIGDFSKVQVAVTPEGLVFTMSLKGGKIAQQLIPLPGIVATTRLQGDREFFAVMDDQGRVLVMDAGLMPGTLFDAPQLANFVVQLRLSPGQAQNARLNFVSRGLRPVSSGLDQVSDGGDLLITDHSSGSAVPLSAPISRDVLHAKVAEAEALTAVTNLLAGPRAQSGGLVRTVFALLRDRELVAAYRELTQTMDPALARTFQSLSTRMVTSLLARASVNQSQQTQNRSRVKDRISRKGWVDSYEKIQAKARQMLERKNSFFQKVRQKIGFYKNGELTPALAENMQAGLDNGDFAEMTPLLIEAVLKDATQGKKTWKDFLTPQVLRWSAALAGGVAVGAGSGWMMRHGFMPHWIQFTLHRAYHLFTPDVLQDRPYSITLLKSAASLVTLTIPVMFTLTWAASAMMRWKLGPSGAFVRTGNRLNAEVFYPIYHRLIGFFRQPNLMVAAQNDLPSSRRVTPSSTLGQRFNLDQNFRLGLMNPFQSRESFEAEKELKLKLLTGAARAEQDRRATAMALALMIVSTENGEIDPAALAIAIGESGDSGVIPETIYARLAEDPALWKKYEQAHEELIRMMERLQLNGAPLLSQIDPQELSHYLSAAQVVARQLTVEKNKPVLEKCARLWRKATRALRVGSASFAVNERRFLKVYEASDFVKRLVTQSYIIDQLIVIFQVALFSERANLKNPSALFADANGPAYTNKGFFAEMIEQTLIGWLAFSSQIALVYGRAAKITESRYDAPQYQESLGDEKTESFFSGILDYVMNALNLKEADYARRVFLKRLTSSLSTVQSGWIFGVFSRVASGVQTFTQAQLPWLAVYIASTPVFGWIWGLSRGLEMSEDKMGARKEEWDNIRVRLMQGLEIQDDAQIRSAVQELRAIYAREGVALPEVLQTNLAQVEQFFSLSGSERVLVNDWFNEGIKALMELDRALHAEEGGDEAVAQAEAQLRARYQESPIELLERVNQLRGEALLEYARKNPPYNTKIHGLVSWGVNAFIAIATTMLAVPLYVFSFRPDVNWGFWLPAMTAYAGAFYTSAYYGLDYLAKKFPLFRGEVDPRKTWSRCRQALRL